MSREQGFPQGGPAPELIESGFALENADAGFLHHGLNLADLAHVLDLARRDIVPDDAVRHAARAAAGGRRRCRPSSSRTTPPTASRTTPGSATSSPGSATWPAGCTPGGRAGRRPGWRCGCTCAASSPSWSPTTAEYVATATERAAEHAETLLPDQTYLQQAQPSTFGHYLLAFAYPAVRDARRLLDELDWVNGSPGGAGCVNGTRLLDDRGPIADALGFGHVIPHTRDAMWQVDGLVHILATAASLLSNLSKLAEDLEIFSSSEFDFVDLDDAFTRASILMPNKRNPYALAIVRGASGVLIGRLTGFLAVTKSPSARSDNLIFAYGEVPRALDLAGRITRLMTGVVRTLRLNPDRMRSRAGPGLHPGHRPGRAPRAAARGGLPHRLRGGRQHGAGGGPGRRPGARDHRRDARRGGAGARRAAAGGWPGPTCPRCWTRGGSCCPGGPKAAPHPDGAGPHGGRPARRRRRPDRPAARRTAAFDRRRAPAPRRRPHRRRTPPAARTAVHSCTCPEFRRVTVQPADVPFAARGAGRIVRMRFALVDGSGPRCRGRR